MDSRYILNDEIPDESSTNRYPSDRPEVTFTVREVRSEESCEENPILTAPNPFLGQPLFESPGSIRQDASYQSDWVSLPALLSHFENLKDREQIFETWRYKITLDIDVEYAARRDAVARMELLEKLREMTMNDRSLVDVMALVKYWDNGLRTRDALILVFESIRLALNTKLGSIKQQLVDLEDTNDDFSDLELGAPQELIPNSSNDATEQEGTNAEEAMHEFIVSLGRVTPTMSDIEHQMDEEDLEKEVHAGPNHFSDGSYSTSIDRTNYSQAEVSTNLTDNDDDSFDEEVLETCSAIPIEDAVQHMSGRLNPADIPRNGIEETLHDLKHEITKPPAQDIINQTITDAAQSLIDLANAGDGIKQEVGKDNEGHDQISLDTSMFKGGADIEEEVFDPDKTKEEIDDDEEEHTEIALTDKTMWRVVLERAGHSLPLPKEAPQTSAGPSATKLGADDNTFADTISIPSRHLSCDPTCHVFASFLSTMKELYISPRAFCELLADNVPMLETMSLNAIDPDSVVRATIENVTATRCLLGEEIEETARLRIEAFTRSLEDLHQQVKANNDLDPEGSDTSLGHNSATESFLSGVTSLLEFGKLVLHKTDNIGERHGPGARNSRMSQEINNPTVQGSGRKKKKNKKKKPKAVDDLKAVSESPATVPQMATYKIRLEPAVKYDSIARSSRNLFRETLERIKSHRLPVMPGADGEIPETAFTTAATIVEGVIGKLDQAPEGEGNLSHENFGDLLEYYVYSRAYKTISEGVVPAKFIDAENGSNVDTLQLFKNSGDELKAGSQRLEAILKFLRPGKLPTPGGLVLLKSSEGVDRYARELADEIEDKLCLTTIHVWLTAKTWNAIAGQCRDVEMLFAADMEQLPECFELTQRMTLEELEAQQRQLVAEKDFDIETRTFRGDATKHDKINAIAVVRALDYRLHGDSETEDSKVMEVYTTFDYEGHLRTTCPGEDWTCVMLRRGSLSETFRVIRRSDVYLGQISCILRYAPLVLGLGPDAPPPQLRQDHEAFAWNLCGNFPPIDPDYAEPMVAVPRVLGRRPADHILVMDDMGDLTALDHAFLEICPPNRQLISEHHAYMRFSEIGSRLGAWLANLHIPLSQNQHASFTNTASFNPSKMRALIRNYKYTAIGSFLEKFGAPDSRRLGQRVIEDFDFQFPKDCQVFAVGDLPLSAVLVQMPLVANGRVALADWEFSGPGRGINGDMAQLLAGVHQFMFQIKGIDFESPKRAMDGFVEAIVRNYVAKSRPRGSTLVMKKGQSPREYGCGKRRLPPKIAAVLRSAFIVYGAELIFMAGGSGYKCKDLCCMEGIGECQRLKGLARRGTWFLRMAGENENEFQDKNWKEICNTEATRGVLGLVFDYDTLF